MRPPGGDLFSGWNLKNPFGMGSGGGQFSGGCDRDEGSD